MEGEKPQKKPVVIELNEITLDDILDTIVETMDLQDVKKELANALKNKKISILANVTFDVNVSD